MSEETQGFFKTPKKQEKIKTLRDFKQERSESRILQSHKVYQSGIRHVQINSKPFL